MNTNWMTQTDPNMASMILPNQTKRHMGRWRKHWFITGQAVLLLIIAAGWLQSAMAETTSPAPLDQRHQPSGINSQFNFNGHTFSDYRQHIKAIITQARVDLDRDNRPNLSPSQRQDIITANLPFELLPASSCPNATSGPPYQRGILLIHGLSDSPYWVRHLGDFLQQQCFYVVAILLPGNGTRPGDLLDTRWQEWQKATNFGVELVRGKTEQLWIGGFSTGATLALQQAQHRDDLAGLIMISPALRLPSLAAFAGWRQWFGQFYQPALWWQIMPDTDPYKYESFPVNAISELYKLIETIEPVIQQPPVLPVFIAASEDDATVDSRATVDIFKRWPQHHKKLVWYSREMEPQQGLLQIIDSRSPEQHISSSSHISLPMPATDPYYGTNGPYTACAHYFADKPREWQLCQARQEDLLAETTPYFLSQGVVRRLIYNPYFDEMLQAIAAFINEK